MTHFAEEAGRAALASLGHQAGPWYPGGTHEIYATCLGCGLEIVVSFTHVAESYRISGPASEGECCGSTKPPRSDTPLFA